MAHTEKCRRCMLPILGAGYVMHLDSREPKPAALEVVLCDSCVDSMSRWLTRRGRPKEVFQTGVAMAIEDHRPSPGRVEVRDQFAATLDRFDWSDRQRVAVGLLLGGIAMAFAVALVVLVIVSDGVAGH